MNFLSLIKRKIIYQFKNKISIDPQNFQDKSLDELFNFYGSDKANIFRNTKSKGHGFSNFYTSQFSDLKNKKINILEIGSYAGASAASFVKFFNNSKVFCFDINISNFRYKSKNIFVYGVDANNKIKINKIIKKIFSKNNFEKFDIIIDDGSHLLSDIIQNLNYFFKNLKSGGIYVIEDFKHPNYYKYNRNINEIFIDEMLNNFKNKKFFRSNLLSQDDQQYLIKNIYKIDIFKGNLSDSDICFLKKN